MHDQSFDSVRQAVKPVTAQDLDEALMLLRYDLHREMQDIIREQIRQFSIAKVSACFEQGRVGGHGDFSLLVIFLKSSVRAAAACRTKRRHC
jgi:hypothetical protein